MNKLDDVRHCQVCGCCGVCQAASRQSNGDDEFSQDLEALQTSSLHHRSALCGTSVITISTSTTNYEIRYTG